MSRSIESKVFWQEQLDKFKASGLARSQYCRDNKINYDRFGYWIKRLTSVSPSFVPIKVEVPTSTASQLVLCTIELRGHIIKIYELSALSFLLERLS